MSLTDGHPVPTPLVAISLVGGWLWLSSNDAGRPPEGARPADAHGYEASGLGVVDAAIADGHVGCRGGPTDVAAALMLGGRGAGTRSPSAGRPAGAARYATDGLREPWQHLSQPRFFAFLLPLPLRPRGFLDGHCLPVWIQASAPMRPFFFLASARVFLLLLSATALTPTAASAPPGDPLQGLAPARSLGQTSDQFVELFGIHGRFPFR